MDIERDLYRVLVRYVHTKTLNGWKDSASKRYSFLPRFDRPKPTK